MVTEKGGALSHAGITCREAGKPCVAGCQGALAAIPDGSQVTVDGDEGRVSVVVQVQALQQQPPAPPPSPPAPNSKL